MASRIITARYDGECVECDSAIYEGDNIVMTDDGAVCIDCAPDDTVREPVTFPL